MRQMFEPFRRMTDLRGRTRRSAFWGFALLAAAMVAGSGVFDALTRGRPGVASLVTVGGLAWPLGAACVRRLHDGGRDGRFLLLLLIPGLGIVALGVLLAVPGEYGVNRHGADPRSI